MTEELLKLAAECATNKYYKKRSAEGIAESLLQGWAFLGVSREQHAKDIKILADIIRKERNG